MTVRFLKRSSLDLVPPDSIASPVSVNDDFIGATGGLADAFFIGHAHIDLQLDVVGQAFLPEFRLIIGAQAFGELQLFIGIRYKSQQACHHPLFG